MKKVINSSVKKILDKKEQKVIVGGSCPGGGYPRERCFVNGKWIFVCPGACLY
jgi:hypothetical protein